MTMMFLCGVTVTIAVSLSCAVGFLKVSRDVHRLLLQALVVSAYGVCAIAVELFTGWRQSPGLDGWITVWHVCMVLYLMVLGLMGVRRATGQHPTRILLLVHSLWLMVAWVFPWLGTGLALSLLLVMTIREAVAEMF